MRAFYLWLGVLAAAAVGISVMLLPDSDELSFMRRKNPDTDNTVEVIRQKQVLFDKQAASGGADSKTVSDLADSYIEQGKNAQAIKVMEEYLARNPGDIRMLDKLGIIYQISGQDDKYLAVLEEENALAPSASIAGILQARYGDAQPEKNIQVTRELIELQPGKIQNYKDLVRLLLLVHRDDEALATLQEIKNRYPENMDYNLIYTLADLLLKKNRAQEAYDDTNEWIKQNPAAPVADLVSLFYNAHHPEFAAKLLAGQKDNVMKDPALFLLYVKTVAAGDPDGALRLSSGWMAAHPEDMKMLGNLGNVFFEEKRYGEILKLYAPFKSKVDADPNLSGIYREALYAQLREYLAADSAKALEFASGWMKLYPADTKTLEDFSTIFFEAKRYGEVLALLEPFQKEMAADTRLQDIYREALLASINNTLATDPQKSLQLASDWMKAHPQNDKMLEDFGFIFFEAKYYNEVIRLYRPYKKEVLANQKLRFIYREALISSLKTHPENLPELTRLYEDELNDPHTTPQRRKQILYAMMATGAGHAALPYAEQSAFTLRGDWVFLYETFLKQLHETQRLAAFRSKYVHTVPLTDKEKRYYADIYLDEGNKPEAMRLLKALADKETPDREDVQTLVYLWGFNPQPDELNWLEQRAVHSSGDEQIKWLQLLMDVRAYDRVIRIAGATPVQTRSMKLTKIYFEALQDAGDKAALKTALQSSTQQTDDKDKLDYLSGVAMANGFFDIAGTGYEKLIALNTGDIEYVQKRGMAAYNQSKSKLAATYLGQYYQQGGTNAKALFTYAELLNAHDKPKAAPVYEAALNSLAAIPKPGVDDRIMKAKALARLGRMEEADKEMQALLAAHPGDASIEIEYAQLLADNKQYEKAEAVLKQSEVAVPSKPGAQVWRISRQNVVNVERTAYSNELVLAYDRPTDKLSEIKRVQNHHPDWISAVNPGYDKVLLVASPDTKLESSYEGGDIIVTAQNPVPAGVDRSLAVRRELLYAQIEQKTGRKREALDRLAALHDAQPHDVGVLTSLASAERDNGQRLPALDLAMAAYMEAPEDSWVNALLDDMKKSDRPYVRADVQWVHMDDNDQFIQSLSGMDPITRNFKVAATVENNFYSVKNYQLADGVFGKSSGNAQRGSIDGLYEFDSGPLSETSLYVNPDSLGFGEEVSLRDPLGVLKIFGQYHRADWTFTERIADDVTHDRVGVEQAYSPIANVSTSIGVAATNYNQDNQDSVTKSVSLYGGISAPVSVFDEAWSDIPVTVGYNFDGEFVTSRTLGVTGGSTYFLYPLFTREVHSVIAGYTYTFDDTLVGIVQGGYSYDAYSGDSGPSIMASLTKDLGNGLEAQLRAGRGVSFLYSGNGITTAGGYLIYKF